MKSKRKLQLERALAAKKAKRETSLGFVYSEDIEYEFEQEDYGQEEFVQEEFGVGVADDDNGRLSSLPGF
jgi:hypothetical protein